MRSVARTSQPSCSVNTHCAHRLARSPFVKGAELTFSARSQTQSRRGRSAKLEIRNFKFLKDLGLKKPAFLPDFGKEKRKALLDSFYTTFDNATLSPLLADDLEIYDSDKLQDFKKKDYLNLVCDRVKPAIPDFSFSHVTTGEKDDAGYCTVRLQAVGHHTGKSFSLRDEKLPPIEASGRPVRQPEQTAKVKVEDGKIVEIRFLAQEGAGPVALYKALGGKVP